MPDREDENMTYGAILIILLVVLAVVGAFSLWHARKNAREGKKNMTDAAALLLDRFHRARHMDEDG